MDIGRSRFEAAAALLDGERARFDARGRRAPDETTALAYEEIRCSARLAGVELDVPAVRAAVERGAAGPGPIDGYVLAVDYAAAVRSAAASHDANRHGFLRTSDIVTAHATATRREPDARPGQWRTGAAPPFPSGAVPCPAWRIPRDVEAFVERISHGPPPESHPVAWVASAHERFARIHPFTRANGRTGRIVTNLLLRRLGYPPFAVRARDARRYVAAFRQADSRDPWPLALVFARALLESQTRLSEAASPSAELRPLADFASGRARAALYKAAQRGRLRSIRRRGALLTSAAWIAAYAGSRATRA